MKKIGVRLGNWLLPDQAITLLEAPDPERMKGKLDLALLAILVAWGLRRHEAVELNASDLQQREDHWAIVDLIGKASHIRTIPVPDWVKNLVDDWLDSAGTSNGRIFQACHASRDRVGKPAERESGLARCQAVCREKLASTNSRRTSSGELAPGSAIRPAAN